MTFEHASLQPDELAAALDAAREAARRLRSRPTNEILERLDLFVAAWLRDDHPSRRLAERILPAATGFSPAMIRHGLRTLLEPLGGGEVRALLQRELGAVEALDGGYGGRRACSPGLVSHVLSGNIPGLAAAPIVLSLAARAAVFVKSASGDPLFPAMFAASLAEADPELGACAVVAHWRGGERGVEDTVFSASDFVCASGSDAAVAAIGARVRGRFAGHGHKVSFAFVAGECLSDAASVQRAADALAYDTSLWDQQGCLSPQLCYLEAGTVVSAAKFAASLGAALASWEGRLPPRRLDLQEQAAVLRFREEALWQAPTAGGAATRLLTSPGSNAWSVRVEPEARFLPTCLNRCLRIQVVSGLEEMRRVLGPHRRCLEAAGIAAGPQRRAEIERALKDAGVHRVCPLGTMQRPSLAWMPGGRPRVADWIEWASTEGGEESG